MAILHRPVVKRSHMSAQGSAVFKVEGVKTFSRWMIWRNIKTVEIIFCCNYLWSGYDFKPVRFEKIINFFGQYGKWVKMSGHCLIRFFSTTPIIIATTTSTIEVAQFKTLFAFKASKATIRTSVITATR